MEDVTPKYAFVAMFDFIGFKKLRESLSTAGLYKLYMRGLLPQIQHAAAFKSKVENRNGRDVLVPDFNESSIMYRVVSDSILLFSNSNSLIDFIQIVSASQSILSFGFVGHKAPLRGAIGYGDLIIDESSIWLGSAIEDAYIGESSQVWSGCRLTKNCYDFILSNNYADGYKHLLVQMANVYKGMDEVKYDNVLKSSTFLVEYPIPTQISSKTNGVHYDSEMGIAINWTPSLYEGAAQKSFAVTTNEHALRIQANTVEFEAWARSLKKNDNRFLLAF